MRLMALMDFDTIESSMLVGIPILALQNAIRFPDAIAIPIQQATAGKAWWRLKNVDPIDILYYIVNGVRIILLI